MKLSKNAMYATGGLLFLVLLYFVFKDKADSLFVSATGYEFDTPPGGLDKNLLLEKGSRGAEVVALQRSLIADGQDIGVGGPSGEGDDGVFGSKTKAGLVSEKGVEKTTLNAYATTASVPEAAASIFAGSMGYDPNNPVNDFVPQDEI